MKEMPLTITEAAAALRSGELSSVQLTSAALKRADALDADLGAYLVRFDATALERAALADKELAAGLDLGRLHGIPVGVKDILAASEEATTANSLVLDPEWGVGKDAIVTERLRLAGAVITGKLTTMEFAIGLHDESKPHPRPRNPWNREHFPGGSSSGSGIGVCTGMFLAGVGSDTGGSIRVPAAYCGVSGLMPTFGRVPTAGCVPLAYSLDHIGPLSRSALDCGLLLAAISGDDPRDPYTVPTPPLNVTAATSLKGLRVGIDKKHHVNELCDPALEPAFDAAVSVLRELGAKVVDVELPLFEEALTALWVTIRCEALAYHLPDMQSRWGDYYEGTRATVGGGVLFSAADYVQAQRVRRLVQRHLTALLNSVDVIATPTTGTGAPSYADLDAHGFAGERMRTVFTAYWDLVGNPALVVPMGVSSDQLPLSLQLGGRPFGEATLVAVGDAFQSVTNWHLNTPPVLAAV